MDKLSYLSNTDDKIIEELYSQYIANPNFLDAGWKAFFEGFEFRKKDFTPSAFLSIPDEFKVINLINGYRERGHLFTKTNPVRTRRKHTPTLNLENFGLKEADLNRTFEAGNEIGIGRNSLRNIVSYLQNTYCHSVGVEFAFIRNKEIERWLKEKMEPVKNAPSFTVEEKIHILEKLTEAVFFEKFLHKRFQGQKRFSLEGVEALIPALDAVVEKGATLGVQEFVIGMPHRGRLNVLANILKKKYKDIFLEFEGKEYEDQTLMGDVKYHLGYSNNRFTRDGKPVHLTLSPNPSHLEAVNPVVEGIVRARLDGEYNGNTDAIVPILIHGDASVAGQGIIYELLQMSELEGYRTGGTIHLVANNQIGFTTNYLDARSSVYCTDIAKIIQSPIFHVNADDVEEVVYTVQLAMEYRQRFHKDVFIDLLGYRKYGHNEGDEPRYTQPVLYKIIEKHPNPQEIYARKLTEENSLNTAEIKSIENTFNEKLENCLAQSLLSEKTKAYAFFEKDWEGIQKAEETDFDRSPDTSVSYETLKILTEHITLLPEDKQFYRKIMKLQEERRQMVFEKNALDWAMGELLAYATLLNEGFPVRLSGQDSRRGTFSHRHSTLTVEDSEEQYSPLNHIGESQAPFSVYNSLLSEYGVLGFEYGYALATPNALTIWEAQFGDFSNGAQIIIDQYISSAEEKWKVMNGLVMLLPHGYEGQGPEHSSARLERFLTLCADNNMQVANCTTPANFFHLLRRQLHRNFRKPLAVFTPKSLLRHPLCVSPLEGFTSGSFSEVLDDAFADPLKVKKVLLCTGKIFYELLEEKQKLNAEEVAIVRIEQLYPFPALQIEEILKKYRQTSQCLWVQEEPANMGAWTFVSRNFRLADIMLVARPESGSPATGSSKLHTLRQRKIVEKAFGECICDQSEEYCKMTCALKEWHYVKST
ncbi:MAG: 2-oxoglutarate dehydrogenase E1 component [Lentimicrobiaceae bacterium]|nr:2-oxoglutarate dehydrogenase E1 component [Lentimicrobiaceae bacterium]